jgi:predicted NUDIX family phosphoesterase
MTTLYILIALACGVFLGYMFRSLRQYQMRDEHPQESRLPPEPYTPETFPVSYSSFVNPHKRHPQHILAMEAEFFDRASHFMKPLNRLSHYDFLGWPQTAAALVIKERAALEPNGNYRQLLPYTVVRRRDSDGEMRYLAYERTQRVGEQRLAGKVSIGFGGHIDGADVVYDDGGKSIINLSATIMDSAIRERREELKVKGERDAFHGICVLDDLPITWGEQFITQQSSPERMHLGIVMFINLPPDIECECAEAELLTLGMKTASELMAAHLRGDITLEAWSELLLGTELIEEGRVERQSLGAAFSHEPL